MEIVSRSQTPGGPGRESGYACDYAIERFQSDITKIKLVAMATKVPIM